MWAYNTHLAYRVTIAIARDYATSICFAAIALNCTTQCKVSCFEGFRSTPLHNTELPAALSHNLNPKKVAKSQALRDEWLMQKLKRHQELERSQHPRLGRVRFFALLQPMKALMREGYPLCVIHERYQETLVMSYSQFTRYVARYIDLGRGPEGTQSIPAASGKDTTPLPSPPPKAVGQPRFIYDNTATKESLI